LPTILKLINSVGIVPWAKVFPWYSARDPFSHRSARQSARCVQGL